MLLNRPISVYLNHTHLPLAYLSRIDSLLRLSFKVISVLSCILFRKNKIGFLAGISGLDYKLLIADRGLNEREACDGLNAGRKWL